MNRSIDHRAQCGTCGYTWPRGQDGSHSCVGYLHADLQEAKKDAERYRWLRDSKTMQDLPQVYADDDCNTWLTGDELDAAVDAAMQHAPLIEEGQR